MSIPKYDHMIYKVVPHGIEVIFINIVDGVEVIYEDFFDHQDLSSIQNQFLKYN